MAHLEAAALIQASGVVPIFNRDDVEEARSVARAIASAGGRVLEFTNRTPNASDAFSRLAAHVASEHPQVVLGAGTIFDAATASRFIENGAGFIVGPTFSEDVYRLCQERAVLYVPGCFTATEVRWAAQAGCHMVKLFPAEPMGPDYLRALSAVFPSIAFVPTGGIAAETDTVVQWWRAGAAAVGLGSALIPSGETTQGDLTEIAATLARVRARRESAEEDR